LEQKLEIRKVVGRTVAPLHESEISNWALWMRKEGYSEHTIISGVKVLRRLDRRCDVLDPESVKRFLGNATSFNVGGKLRFMEDVDRFYRFMHVTWVKPKYQRVDTLPFVPHTEEVDALVSGLCNSLVDTFAHLLNLLESWSKAKTSG
jgi:hypothetical protein